MNGEDVRLMPGYGKSWFVSWHNFEGLDLEHAKPIRVHDVTLREMAQQAGARVSVDEKIEIARALAELGVDRIDGGALGGTPEELETLRRLRQLGPGPELWAVARPLPQDIDEAIELGLDGVGVTLLANDQHCRAFGWTALAALGEALAAGARAKAAGLRTTLLIVDSSRMACDRLDLIVRRASAGGGFDALALMDSFGALSPRGTDSLVRIARSLTTLDLEFHAQNDFGMATANALASIEAGADVVHTSVLGLGERAGNPPLEEVALSAPLLSGRASNLKLRQLRKVTDLVQRCSGIVVADNKPVTGSSYSRNGPAVREYRRRPAAGDELQWLFPYDPALVGADPVHSGLGAAREARRSAR